MSTIARRLAAVAVILTLILALAAGLGQAQGTTTLKIQAAWPPASMLWENSKLFAERVGSSRAAD
jgi:TRAP-type C4-dicarboxylate transport system substrate-binding protein